MKLDHILYSSSLVLALLLTGSATAQDADYFRISGTTAGFLSSGGNGTEPPENGDGQENENPSGISLSYPARSASPGDTVTVDPVYAIPPGGIASFYWSGLAPDNAELDESTGRITWVIGDEGGSHRAAVTLEADTGEITRANFDLEVISSYKISVDPDAFTFQQGNSGINRAFLASLVGTPSTTDAEEWFLRQSYDSPEMIYTASSSSAILDVGAIYDDLGYVPVGEHWIQFGRHDASGETVLSTPVTITVTPGPDLVYATEETVVESSYRIDDKTLIHLLAGAPVHIESIFLNGATGVPQTWPAWVDPIIDLPPGITLTEDGDLVGTTTALPDSEFTSYIPVISDEGAYAAIRVDIIVVDEIPQGPLWPDDDDDPNDWDGDGIPNDADPDPYIFTDSFYWSLFDDETGLTGPFLTPYAAIQDGMDLTGVPCMQVFVYPYDINGYGDPSHLC